MTKETGLIRIAGTDIKMRDFTGLSERTIVETFLSFIDVANTATDRATFYNTKGEQRKAVADLHKSLYSIDRGVYGACLLLDGVTDYTRIVGIENLLEGKENREVSTISLETESNMIVYLLSTLPVQRMLKVFLDLKEKRVNNARTRKIILMSILNSPSLPYWSVKYRSKIASVLEHAWGKRTTSIIRSILSKKVSDWDAKEQTIMVKNVSKYVVSGRSEDVYECLAFILRSDREEYTLETLKSFQDAKSDLSKGSKLPREVLEGIRGTYHKGSKSSADVLQVTKETLTEREKMKVQKKAAEHKVDVKFNAMAQDSVDLYIHAYETGMNDEIKEALIVKATKSAQNSPISYSKIGIVIDASGSSSGNKTQKLRPLAISLSIRDMLEKCATEKSFVEYVGGKKVGRLVYPSGDTNIAKPLVDVLKNEPDAVFIISDGYENAPAGRVNEVIKSVKNMGINIPIYQINPVTSAEAGGIRKLSDEVSVIPANKPASIGLGMVKAMLESNLKDGILGLFNITLKKLKK